VKGATELPYVLDASVTLAWCFEDEATPGTDGLLERLAEDAAITPSLWELEVVNVLLLAERRGRITESQATRFVALLTQLPIHVDPAGADMEGVLAAGRHHGLTAYDAAYLVLAEREGIPLATLDTRLRDAARAAGVPVLGAG
jgi:predicted nucleic acid-binding protein